MTMQTTCPCGETIEVPLLRSLRPRSTVLSSGEIYDISVRCGSCRRTATSGNTVTGEVTGWMTEKDLDAINKQYEIDNFSSDMNEFHGRGNW